MDGLTINTANSILKTGTTTTEINRVNQPATPSTGIADTQKSFAASLKDAVQQVNVAQKDSDLKMQELATGKSQNIHETMIAAEKADIALRLMVQVRNKMIEAYQEIMKMQV
jgi:flagellar hook-basal body complex protein FliE